MHSNLVTQAKLTGRPPSDAWYLVTMAARYAILCMQGYSIPRSEHPASATVKHDWLADCHGLLRLRGFAVPHYQVPPLTLLGLLHWGPVHPNKLERVRHQKQLAIDTACCVPPAQD